MMTGPAQVPGPTVAPSAWASVRLIQGASKANQWQIDSKTTRAQLTVGADKACDWPVAADRVAAIHFELFWDGRRLWIADTREAGGVTVDGGRLTTWQPITGRARIEFGGAVMLAECSVPAVSIPGESIDMDPTQRPGQPGTARGVPTGPDDDERTTLHVRDPSPMPAAGKPHAHGDDRVPLHAAPTTISEMPDGLQPYGGPPPMPPGSGMSPPAILQSKKPVVPVPTIIAEPGRMPPGLQMPVPGPIGVSPPMPRPGMGMATPDPAMRPGPGMMGPPMPPPHGMVQPLPTPTGRPAWMDRLGLPKTSVPPRTWGLIIVTVAALMFVMFMGGDDPPKRKAARKPAAVAATEGASQPGATQPGTTQPGTTAAGTETRPAGTETKPAGTETKPAGTETKPAGTESKPAGTESKPAGTETKPSGSETKPTGSETKPTGSETKPTASEAKPETDAAGLATPAQGADLLLAGRQREALAVYDELARRHPDQPGYAAIVKILKRRLVERCKDKQPGESPCPPAP